MSYAGPARGESARPPENAKSGHRPPGGRPPARRPLARPHDTDWQQVALFGAGLALGIALGAGIAMLTAPQTGEETRADLRRFATRKRRMIGRRSSQAWEDFQSELRGARQAMRRRKAARAAEQEAEAYGG